MYTYNNFDALYVFNVTSLQKKPPGCFFSIPHDLRTSCHHSSDLVTKKCRRCLWRICQACDLIWWKTTTYDPKKERSMFCESGCHVLDLMFYKQDGILLACYVCWLHESSENVFHCLISVASASLRFVFKSLLSQEFWGGLDVYCMGVSTNNGTPKRMVYNGKPYQIGWFGGTTIFGNIHIGMFQLLIGFQNRYMRNFKFLG